MSHSAVLCHTGGHCCNTVTDHSHNQMPEISFVVEYQGQQRHLVPRCAYRPYQQAETDMIICKRFVKLSYSIFFSMYKSYFLNLPLQPKKTLSFSLAQNMEKLTLHLLQLPLPASRLLPKKSNKTILFHYHGHISLTFVVVKLITWQRPAASLVIIVQNGRLGTNFASHHNSHIIPDNIKPCLHHRSIITVFATF